MKTLLKQSILLTACLLFVFAVLYPLMIAGIAKLAPGGGDGVKIEFNGKVVGYENIAQKFTDDQYFWGRPSAVEYNSAGSGGSNKGSTDTEYLGQVQARIDTFLVHNPSVKMAEIPAELVTASASGLDPHISPKAAYIQIPRISKVRNIPDKRVEEMVTSSIEKPLFGIFGPSKINLLKLNIALDKFKK